MRRETGVAAIWTASALLFLLGAAALAVDISGFYQDARSQQRAADLACLAGAWKLPDNPAAAVTTAADFLRPNEPGLAGLDPAAPTTGSPGVDQVVTYLHGNYAVEIETPFAGRATKMRVSILQASGTSFAKVLGSESVDVLEEAICEVGSALGNSADQPFGVLQGFTGGIVNFGPGPGPGNPGCELNGDTNSRCSGLAIPRHDDPPGSSDIVHSTGNYIANMIEGINWDLEPGVNVPCRLKHSVAPNDPEPCDWVSTISGNDPSKLYAGLIEGVSTGQTWPGSNIGYLERDPSAYHHQGNHYDGHELGDVAECVGGCPATSESLGWEDEISAGTFDPPPVVTVTKITDCDCPRFTRVPIVDSFPQTNANCTVFDPDDPNSLINCAAHIVGFENIYLMRPFYNLGDGPDPSLGETDFGSSGKNVQTIAAVVIEFSPDIEVEGDCFSEFVPGSPKAVRLVDA